MPKPKNTVDKQTHIYPDHSTSVNQVEINSELSLFRSNEALKAQNQLLNEQNKQLDLFLSIIKFSEQQNNTAEIYAFYLKIIVEVFQCKLAHIYFVDEVDGQSIHFESTDIWYSRNSNANELTFIEITKQTRCAITQEMLSRVYDTKKLLSNPTIFQCSISSRLQAGHEANLSNYIAVPFIRYGKVIAIAEFFSIPISNVNDILAVIEAAAMQLTPVLERRFSENQSRQNYHHLQQTHAELKATQAQLIQNSKLASIGQLAAGVAHEINNPIAFIANNNVVLKKYLHIIKDLYQQYSNLLASIKSSENIQHLHHLVKQIEAFSQQHNLDFMMHDIDLLMEDSMDGVNKVADIILGLKTFARVDEAESSEVNINECIENTLKIIWNELKYKCTLTKDLAQLPNIYGYPNQLNQVFMNLLVNAAQAIEKEGTITIKTFMTNSTLQIEISDTGSGIDAKHMGQIFDPFFTTKPVGSGTGLGLSISYGIIKKHGGDIQVESRLGHGTLFRVILPMITQ